MLEASTALGPPPPNPASSLDEALGALFALGAGALHARRCSLYLCADGGRALTLAHASGPAAPAEASYIPVEDTIAGVVVRSRVPLLVQNVAAYSTLPVHPERYLTPSFLSVPVLVENEAIGVLNAADRQDDQPFSEDDLRSAEMVARSMAAVLHSDLLTQRVLGESEVDPVTGLYNLRHFEKRLAQEVERAQRARLPLTLLLIEVSSYSDLAVRVGVQVAGVLIRCIGEMVGQTVRQSDVLARRADAEIAVLLPSAPLDKAQRVARSIAREVVHEKLPAQLRYDLDALNICIGVAALASGMDGAGLLQRADEALAQAHERGDAVVAATGDELTEVARRTRSRAAHQQAIAAALRLGIPYLASPADVATAAAMRLLSVEMARTYACIPVAFEMGTLTLAMADPIDTGAIQAVSQLTNMAIFPVASPREKILQAIATMMGEREGRDSYRVRAHMSAVADSRAFANQMRRLADTCDTLEAHDVTFETTIAAQCSSASQRDTLLSVLAAIPDVVVSG